MQITKVNYLLSRECFLNYKLRYVIARNEAIPVKPSGSV